MNYSNNCGNYCEPESFEMSKSDRRALLKEKEAVLEAKLATIKYWIESLDKEESDKK